MLPPAKNLEECAEQCLRNFESFVMASIKEPQRSAELERLKKIIQRFLENQENKKTE